MDRWTDMVSVLLRWNPETIIGFLSEGKHIPPTPKKCTAKGPCMPCLHSNPRGKKEPRKKSSSLPSQCLVCCWQFGYMTVGRKAYSPSPVLAIGIDTKRHYICYHSIFYHLNLALTYFVHLETPGELEG